MARHGSGSDGEGATETWDSNGLSSSGSRQRFITSLLKQVSRAFYLSIRVLPSRMREPVAMAYLLARAADTIADTSSIPAERRLAHIEGLRKIIEGGAYNGAAAKFPRELARLQSTAGERTLLGMLPTVCALMRGLNEADCEAVRSVVMTLTSGMIFDLREFRPDDAGSIPALESTEQLDEYCYLIAGCVGEFWTEISIAHTPSLARWDRDRMTEIGVRFGLALQMTNILRDVPRDLQIGRCYIPRSELDRVGLKSEDLTDKAAVTRARPLLVWGIHRTLEHYRSAEEYILAIPRRSLRLRLAALWPVIIGLETLAKLAGSEEWLDPAIRIRIPRSAVYGIIALSLLSCFSDALIRLWIRRIRRRVEQSIQQS